MSLLYSFLGNKHEKCVLTLCQTLQCIIDVGPMIKNRQDLWDSQKEAYSCSHPQFRHKVWFKRWICRALLVKCVENMNRPALGLSGNCKSFYPQKQLNQIVDRIWKWVYTTIANKGSSWHDSSYSWTWYRPIVKVQTLWQSFPQLGKPLSNLVQLPP